MHRWVWDLRGARPLADGYGYPINAVPHDTPRRPEGPRVLPGTYTVRLTANGKTLTTTVEVKADPRVKLSAAALQQQHRLEVRLAELLSRSSGLVLRARSIAEQVEKLAADPRAPKAPLAELAAKVAVLSAGPKERPPAGEPPPALGGVNRKLAAFYGAVEVDAAPTAALIAEAAAAERELDALARSWAALEAGELARVNAALAAARLPALAPGRRPVVREGDGDEE